MTVAIVLLVYYAAIVFVLIRTNVYLKGGEAKKSVRLLVPVIILILSLVPVIGTFLPAGATKSAFVGWGNIWLAFIGAAGVYFIITYIIRLIFLGKKAKNRSRRYCTLAICGALAFSLVTTAYGNIHANRIIPEYYSMNIDKGAGGSARIVLAADLHLSANSTLMGLRSMVNRINEQEADVVVFAGDMFANSYDIIADPQAYIDELRKIEAKNGVYVVYGNHDVSENLLMGFSLGSADEALRDERMVVFLEDCGFIILEDELAELPGGITLVGRADSKKPGLIAANRKTAAELVSGCDRSDIIVVAAHEPDEYAELAEAGADIVLSGHLHNGQIFPANIFLSLVEENAYGYREINGLHTYVSAGAGTYGPPIRLGTNSDIFVIDITY